jgi:hypothetical protein
MTREKDGRKDQRRPFLAFWYFRCTFFSRFSLSLSHGRFQLCMAFHETYGIWDRGFHERENLGENGTAQYIPPIVIIIVIDVSVFDGRRVDDGLAGGRAKKGSDFVFLSK